MFDSDTLVMFVTASVLLTLAPGPDNIFVLTQSMLRGPKAGILVTLGLCTGLLVHTGAVALGVAAVFQTSALAFTVLKLVGAGYLLYLAVQAFQAAGRGIEAGGRAELNGWALYKRGIVMNVTNPKVSIFFLAFLPQFTNPSHGELSMQLMTLGGLFITSALAVFGVISVLAGRLGEWFQESTKAEKILHRVAGAVFATLAVKLALTEN